MNQDDASVLRSVTVLGSGQMGLVMAQIAAQAGCERVVLWCHDDGEASRLAQSRKSTRLEVFELDERVRVTADAHEAMGHAPDLVVCATPTQFIRSVMGRVLGALPEDPDLAPRGFVSVSKGVENGSLLTPTEVMRDAAMSFDGARGAGLGHGAFETAESVRVAVLSGPTIASELARGLPATMIAASNMESLAIMTQELFTTKYLRVYRSGDPLGVELAGAAKNVIAIAAGILDGLQAGYNAKSALLARGLAEIARLGQAMGANVETFFGIAGAGDLATTCFSPEGRNRSLGEALGKGEALNAYLARTQSVVEGVATSESIEQLRGEKSVELPISNAVYRILRGEAEPIGTIAELMSRSLKEERIA